MAVRMNRRLFGMLSKRLDEAGLDEIADERVRTRLRARHDYRRRAQRTETAPTLLTATTETYGRRPQTEPTYRLLAETEPRPRVSAAPPLPRPKPQPSPLPLPKPTPPPGPRSRGASSMDRDCAFL